MQAYWMIFENLQDDDAPNGVWCAQFGAFDQDDVRYEADDMVNGHLAIRRKNLKIVKFASEPTQADVQAYAAQLNNT